MVYHIRMYVCLGLVLGRRPKINLFGLHYCVIGCVVETKYKAFYSPETQHGPRDKGLLQAACIPGVQQISILVRQTGMCSKNTQLTESKKQHSFGLEQLEFLVNE